MTLPPPGSCSVRFVFPPVGWADGEDEDAALSVGEKEGEVEGTNDGWPDDAVLGGALGQFVGTSDGEFVGLAEGAALGTFVAASNVGKSSASSSEQK